MKASTTKKAKKPKKTEAEKKALRNKKQKEYRDRRKAEQAAEKAADQKPPSIEASTERKPYSDLTDEEKKERFEEDERRAQSLRDASAKSAARERALARAAKEKEEESKKGGVEDAPPIKRVTPKDPRKEEVVYKKGEAVVKCPLVLTNFYLIRRPQPLLNQRQALGLRALLDGLLNKKEQLRAERAGGRRRPVQNAGDAIRWLLDNIADEVEEIK